MNLKRWEEEEGFKSRCGSRLQMIGGSQLTGGGSVFFQISHFIVVQATIKETVRWTRSPTDVLGSGPKWFEIFS